VKKELIDTGKVRLVYRDFPLDRVALEGGDPGSLPAA
jgi:protein-disulfide isomerase